MKTAVKNFENKLAYHCAPAMLGIKPACLISLSKNEECLEENIGVFNFKAYVKGLKICRLCVCRDRVLLLVFNESLLKKQLFSAPVAEVLERFGYSREMTLEQAIGRLAGRIESNGEFPHEIGLFLGYPIDDVMGFIRNKGENYILCGYWKVYSNEETAKRTFNNYNKCRRYLCNKLNGGEDIYKALKII